MPIRDVLKKIIKSTVCISAAVTSSIDLTSATLPMCWINRLADWFTVASEHHKHFQYRISATWWTNQCCGSQTPNKGRLKTSYIPTVHSFLCPNPRVVIAQREAIFRLTHQTEVLSLNKRGQHKSTRKIWSHLKSYSELWQQVFFCITILLLLHVFPNKCKPGWIVLQSKLNVHELFLSVI